MRNFIKKQNGYTLLEVVLYIALVSIIVGSTASLIAVTMQIQTRNYTISEVNQVGSQVMLIITQKIRNSTAVNSPAENNSASSLSLNTPISGNNPTIFSLSSSQMQIQEGVGSPVLLSPTSVTISDLSFTNAMQTGSKSSIKVQFTVAFVNTNNRFETNYSKIFYGSGNIR